MSTEREAIATTLKGMGVSGYKEWAEILDKQGITLDDFLLSDEVDLNILGFGVADRARIIDSLASWEEESTDLDTKMPASPSYRTHRARSRVAVPTMKNMASPTAAALIPVSHIMRKASSQTATSTGVASASPTRRIRQGSSPAATSTVVASTPAASFVHGVGMASKPSLHRMRQIFERKARSEAVVDPNASAGQAAVASMPSSHPKRQGSSHTSASTAVASGTEASPLLENRQDEEEVDYRDEDEEEDGRDEEEDVVSLSSGEKAILNEGVRDLEEWYTENIGGDCSQETGRDVFLEVLYWTLENVSSAFVRPHTTRLDLFMTMLTRLKRLTIPEVSLAITIQTRLHSFLSLQMLAARSSDKKPVFSFTNKDILHLINSVLEEYGGRIPDKILQSIQKIVCGKQTGLAADELYWTAAASWKMVISEDGTKEMYGTYCYDEEKGAGYYECKLTDSSKVEDNGIVWTLLWLQRRGMIASALDVYEGKAELKIDEEKFEHAKHLVPKMEVAEGSRGRDEKRYVDRCMCIASDVRMAEEGKSGHFSMYCSFDGFSGEQTASREYQEVQYKSLEAVAALGGYLSTDRLEIGLKSSWKDPTQDIETHLVRMGLNPENYKETIESTVAPDDSHDVPKQEDGENAFDRKRFFDKPRRVVLHELSDPVKFLCLHGRGPVATTCIGVGCGQSFLYNGDAVWHMRNECNADLFPCRWCQKRFYSYDILVTHQRVCQNRVKVGAPSHTTITCYGVGCTASFPFKGETILHMRECNALTFVCQGCDKGFSSYPMLVSHERHCRQVNDSPNCHVCYKAFKSNETLRKHYRKVHKIDPPASAYVHSLAKVACHLCDKKYKAKETLRKHYRKVHKIEPPATAYDRPELAWSRDLDSRKQKSAIVDQVKSGDFK